MPLADEDGNPYYDRDIDDRMTNRLDMAWTAFDIISSARGKLTFHSLITIVFNDFYNQIDFCDDNDPKEILLEKRVQFCRFVNQPGHRIYNRYHDYLEDGFVIRGLEFELSDLIAEHLRASFQFASYKFVNTDALELSFIEGTSSTEYSDVFLVFDRDYATNFDENDYDEVLRYCKDHGINAAVTSPLIELWLWFHFDGEKFVDREYDYPDYKGDYKKRIEQSLLRLEDKTFSPRTKGLIKRMESLRFNQYYRKNIHRALVNATIPEFTRVDDGELPFALNTNPGTNIDYLVRLLVDEKYL